jgi:hypothetical protein
MRWRLGLELRRQTARMLRRPISLIVRSFFPQGDVIIAFGPT